MHLRAISPAVLKHQLYTWFLARLSVRISGTQTMASLETKLCFCFDYLTFFLFCLFSCLCLRSWSWRKRIQSACLTLCSLWFSTTFPVLACPLTLTANLELTIAHYFTLSVTPLWISFYPSLCYWILSLTKTLRSNAISESCIKSYFMKVTSVIKFCCQSVSESNL